MKILSNGTRFLSCIILFWISNSTSACQPEYPYRPDHIDYASLSGAVIFLGKVISVNEKIENDKSVTQTIKFRSTRWFAGKMEATMLVRGMIAKSMGDRPLCGSRYREFSVKKGGEGEEWLIAGELDKGVVYPSSVLSQRIINGKIPLSTLSQLGVEITEPYLSERVFVKLDSKIKCERPEYPALAIRDHLEGATTIDFLIDINGRVTESRITESSGTAILDDAVSVAFSLCKFEPAIVNGKSKLAWATIKYKWALD